MDKYSGLCLAATLLLGTNAVAGDQLYMANFPPSALDADINGTLGGEKARSLIAACRMGARYYGNVKIDPADEILLLQKCKLSSLINNSWPEKCTILGAVAATSDFYAQNWLVRKFDASKQVQAVDQVIMSLATPKSPALVPMYGQASHWAAIYGVFANLDDPKNKVLKQVRYRDGGAASMQDAGGNSMMDGETFLAGSVFKMSYYSVLDSIATTDPFYNHYVVAFDPPVGAPLPPLSSIQYVGGTPLLEPGEVMNEELAGLLAFDALEAEGLWDDPSIAHELAAAVDSGEVRAVEGRAPDGSPWNYHIVPLVDAAGRTVALVQLRSETGEFEQLRVFDRPAPFSYLSRREADAIARAALGIGEDSRQRRQNGVLRFDPRCGAEHCTSPWMPYYEYEDGSGGHLVVAFDGLPVRL